MLHPVCLPFPAEGSPITSTYTQALWPTARRRAHLAASKCFGCECERCLDPEELGSGLSAVGCPDCGAAADPADPADEDTDWR